MKALSIALLAAVVGGSSVQTVLAAHTAFTEKVLYSFGGSSGDGETPFTGLISVNGMLYGTTAGGGIAGCSGSGASGCGTVFSLDPATGAEKVLYAFCSKTNCKDGDWPSALIAAKKELYGMTVAGGLNNDGTVFAVGRNSGKENVLYAFCSQSNCADGQDPSGPLLDINGTLYGTTVVGGSAGLGTVFSLDPGTGKQQVIYSFNLSDGAVPYAGLIAVDGTLYGTTYSGGNADDGTVFAIDPNKHTERVLYSFCGKSDCADGSEPFSGLVSVNGALFGTTDEGGADDGGTVYSINPKTGAEKVVHSFGEGSDGQTPYAGLIAMNGTLYGTTEAGGSAGAGTVFSLDPKTGAEQVVYSFQGGTDGMAPFANLIALNGALYGTTSEGGAHGDGTVFSLTKKH